MTFQKQRTAHYASEKSHIKKKLAIGKWVTGVATAVISGLLVSYLRESTATPVAIEEPSHQQENSSLQLEDEDILSDLRDYQGLVTEGDKLYSLQRYEEALDAYNTAIRLNHSEPAAYSLQR